MFKKAITWFVGTKVANVEPFYQSREVWSYTHIDPQTKQVGEKPVLVFRKASEGMFWGLPLAKTKRNGKVLYVPRLRNGKKVPALSQMRTLKAARLVRKLGTADAKEFGALNNAVVRVLAQPMPVKVSKPRLVTPARPRYERALPSPFSPIYILQPR
mgnify:CR=1 FL=1